MTREDREHEIADQITYLDQLNDHLRSENPGAALGVLGFSQGVATACRWAVAGRTDIQRLVLWGGTFPPDIGTATMATRLSTCRVALVHGDRDAIVPASAGTQAAARLREAGVPFTLHTYAGGHDLDPITLGRLLND